MSGTGRAILMPARERRWPGSPPSPATGPSTACAGGATSIEDEPAAFEVADAGDDPAVQAERSADLKRLMGCLETLEEDKRRMVLLAYHQGLSRDELAARFNVPVGTVKTWLHRSLARLKECLGE